MYDSCTIAMLSAFYRIQTCQLPSRAIFLLPRCGAKKEKHQPNLNVEAHSDRNMMPKLFPSPLSAFSSQHKKLFHIVFFQLEKREKNFFPSHEARENYGKKFFISNYDDVWGFEMEQSCRNGGWDGKRRRMKT